MLIEMNRHPATLDRRSRPDVVSGQSSTEYLIVTAAFVVIFFAPISGDPLYITVLNAIREFYLGFSAGMSMPVSPLGI